MNQENVAFLLDLLISKVVSRPGMTEPADFILYYRLDETGSTQIMDEVGRITDEVNRGSAITSLEVLERIGIFHRPGMGTGGPTPFVADAFKVWAPDTWERIKNA